jgi:hypothetical protein
MKTLKIYALLIALILTGASLSYAQSSGIELTEEQKEELAQTIEEYMEALNLSEEQKPEFEAITKKYAKQVKAVKEGGGGKMQKYKKVKTIRNNKNAEMEALLSEDQYNIYLEKQEEMKEKMKEKRDQDSKS